MTTELPANPESREESYLAKIAGQNIELPEKPLSRKEQYLAYIAENGASGGGGTSNYNELNNKPSINNVSLQGNKSLSDLGAQATLVSGTNIKTINNQSILGSGNINISGGEAISVGNIQFNLVEESE